MAFENLSDKLNNVFKNLRGKGRLSEQDVKDAMREVRLALLEADVSYKVVKDFIKTVSARATGAEVLEALSPAQMVIKIVNEELCSLMGGENQRLNISSKSPSVVMLVGLQGAGKTTNGAKLAALMRRTQNKRPLLVACDVYRPAAIDQLVTVGGKLDLPVFQEGQGDPVEIARHAIDHARRHGNDLVFLDAMTGQDAVNAAAAFDEQLGVTGVMLTKLDGDARGGAALSVRAVTGKPIKFAGTGEKLDAIEVFHPDRMAGRILGMGDMLTLIEKAEAAVDEKKALALAEKLKKNRFTLTDYLEQLNSVKDMGSLEDIAGMIPGLDAKALQGAKVDEKAMAHTEAIILSMTPQERENPSILNASRKRRIAAGAGLAVVDVNRLLKQYEMMQTMAKQFSGKKGKRLRRGGFPFGF